MPDDDKVTKEVLDIHMKQVRRSLCDIRDGLGAVAEVTKTVTENTIHLMNAKENMSKMEKRIDLEKKEREKDTKDIAVLNTQKKFIIGIGASFVGVFFAWVKSKI